MYARDSERGSILLLVLWIVAALAVLAAMLSVRAKVFARNASYLNAHITGHLEMEGAIQRALYDIIQLPMRKDLTLEEQNQKTFTYTIDGDKIMVTRIPAASKLSIQTVRQQIWKKIFMRYGKSEDEVNDIIASIQDWTDRDSLLHPGGAEDAYYQGLPFPYYPHNDKINDLRELMLIKGIDEEMYYGSGKYPPLTNFFTVRDTGSRIDINSASRALIQTLMETTDEETDAIMEAREKKLFATIQDLADLVGPNAFANATRYFTTTPTTDIMTLRATITRGKQKLALEESFQFNGRNVKWLERREWIF